MTEIYAYDPRTGDKVFIPEDALLQYEGWGISRETGAKMYAAGFTPGVLFPFLSTEASKLIDNSAFFASIGGSQSSIPTPKRRKGRRQLKPLKPWQEKAIEGEKRISIHKGK